jgi:hypothetical protein
LRPQEALFAVAHKLIRVIFTMLSQRTYFEGEGGYIKIADRTRYFRKSHQHTTFQTVINGTKPGGQVCFSSNPFAAMHFGKLYNQFRV